MAAKFVGTFDRNKWWVPVTLFGRFQYPRAVFDTGSLCIIFPGECDYPDSPEEQVPELVTINLRGDFEGPKKTLHLPCRGPSTRRLGSADGKSRHRYEFHADFDVPGLALDRTVPIVFMKTKYPIICVGEYVREGYEFTLSAQGIQIAKRPS